MIAEYARKLSLVAAFGLAAAMATGLATDGAQAQAAPDYAALLAAPDRSDADRNADAHAEDPFGPIDEPTAEEPKRRRGRPRKNKDR